MIWTSRRIHHVLALTCATALPLALGACGSDNAAGPTTPAPPASAPARPSAAAASRNSTLDSVGLKCAAMDHDVTHQSDVSDTRALDRAVGDFHLTRLGTLASVDYVVDISRSSMCQATDDQHRAPDGSTLRFADFTYQPADDGSRSALLIQSPDNPREWDPFAQCQDSGNRPTCGPAENLPTTSTLFASLKPGQRIVVARGGTPTSQNACPHPKAWSVNLFTGAVEPMAKVPTGWC